MTIKSICHTTQVAPDVVLVDHGDRFVLTQTDEDGVHDIHLEVTDMVNLASAIMSRFNA